MPVVVFVVIAVVRRAVRSPPWGSILNNLARWILAQMRQGRTGACLRIDSCDKAALRPRQDAVSRRKAHACQL